jgi:hypothetical protein
MDGLPAFLSFNLTSRLGECRKQPKQARSNAVSDGRRAET